MDKIKQKQSISYYTRGLVVGPKRKRSRLQFQQHQQNHKKQGLVVSRHFDKRIFSDMKHSETIFLDLIKHMLGTYDLPSFHV